MASSDPQTAIVCKHQGLSMDFHLHFFLGGCPVLCSLCHCIDPGTLRNGRRSASIDCGVGVCYGIFSVLENHRAIVLTAGGRIFHRISRVVPLELCADFVFTVAWGNLLVSSQ